MASVEAPYSRDLATMGHIGHIWPPEGPQKPLFGLYMDRAGGSLCGGLQDRDSGALN